MLKRRIFTTDFETDKTQLSYINISSMLERNLVISCKLPCKLGVF
jgi:hypothetical protein